MEKYLGEKRKKQLKILMKITKNFNSKEFDLVPGDGRGRNMDVNFVICLQHLRDEINRYSQKLGREKEVKLIVNSGWRNDGNHNTGKAVDLKVINSYERFLILKFAFKLGFTRIGIYDLHIHLDNVVTNFQHVSWWGKSK